MAYLMFLQVPFDGFVLGERRGANLAGEASLTTAIYRSLQLYHDIFSCQWAYAKRCTRRLEKQVPPYRSPATFMIHEHCSFWRNALRFNNFKGVKTASAKSSN